MIGDALHHLLSTQPNLVNLVNGRVSPVDYPPGGGLPALIYNTKNVTRIACRDRTMDIRTGIVEVGTLTEDPIDLERIADALTHALDGYSGVHEGYGLSLSAYEGEFDQKDFELNAYYKPLQFEFTATHISPP